MNTLSRRRMASAFVVLTLGSQVSVVSAQDANENLDHNAVDEIIVQGIPLDRTVKGLAQPADVLSGDELLKRQAASLGETLAHEIGVSSSYFGPVSSRPIIRGQYGERIRVLSNGLDAIDASALSEDHATSVDSSLAEHIEIIRGPATLLYGSGAAGGVINVVDNRILQNGLDEPFGGRVVLGTDSATGSKSGAGELTFGTGAFGFHLDYFRRDTDDIEIPGFAESARFRALEEAEEGGEEEEGEEEAFGSVENTSSEAQGGAAAFTYTGDNGYLGISFSKYENLYGIPGAHHHHEEGEEEEEEEEEEELVTIDLDQSRIDLEGAYRFAELGELKVKLARNDYEHVELEGDEIGTLFNTEGTDFRAEFRHQPFGSVEGSFGVQHKSIDFEAIGEEAFVPPSETEQTSLFAFEEWQATDDWTLQGSARFESQTIDAPSLPSYDENAFGASIGAIRSLGEGYSVALNLALTERHPNAAELYSDGAHVAVQRVERGSVTQGNGLFDKETSTNFDLTFRGENSRFEWAVTAFLNDIDDYILLTPTDLEEDELQVFDYRQTDARLYGLEAEARVELFDLPEGHLHTRLFTDYVYGEDEGTGDYLPRLTPLRYGIELHYTRDSLDASIEATFHSKQDKVAANELPTDSYTLLSAEVSYAFAEPDVYVFLRGTNLTDEDARQHASPLKDTVPLPGRSIQLGLRYDF
ncbi:MAG: TonB-dependent receptor [Pseudomonadota bacterium]